MSEWPIFYTTLQAIVYHRGSFEQPAFWIESRPAQYITRPRAGRRGSGDLITPIKLIPTIIYPMVLILHIAMVDRVDILNGAAVAAKAGTRKSPGSRKVGVALLWLDSRFRGNDGGRRGYDGGGGGVPGNGFALSSTCPDGSLEAARGEIRPEIRNPCVCVTKKVTGVPERAKIRRRMELGSSLG